jgi:hypothetical protein
MLAVLAWLLAVIRERRIAGFLRSWLAAEGGQSGRFGWKMRPGGDPFTRKTTTGPRQHDIKMNFGSILITPADAL